MIKNLIKGRYGLHVTFWVFGVLGILILMMQVQVLSWLNLPKLLRLVVAIVLLVYLLLVFMGIMACNERTTLSGIVYSFILGVMVTVNVFNVLC